MRLRPSALPGMSPIGLLDHLPVGACVFDPSLRVCHWNTQLEDWTGESSMEMKGKGLEEVFPQLARRRLKRRVIGVLERGTPLRLSAQLHPNLLEMRMLDGSLRVQSYTLSRVDLDSGPHLLVVIEDVSDLARVIEEQRRLRAITLAEIEERRRAERDASRRARELEQFAGVVAHDLRAPARQIRQLAQLAQEDFATGDREGTQAMLQKMEHAGARLERMVEHILQDARAAQGPESPAVPLESALRDAVVDLSSELEGARVNIAISGVPRNLGDEVRMHQLFLNLLSNAIKFRDDSKTLRTIHVEGVAAKQEGFVALEVRDNGIGIEARHLNEIFLMFRRLDDDAPGAGIGLAVCKKVVALEGGTISVRSEVGVGTTFHVELPWRPIQNQRPSQMPLALARA